MGYTHHDTPKKAMVRGTISFLESQKIPYFKSRVFHHFDLPRRSGYRVLDEENARRHHNNPDIQEQRGRKPVLSSKDLLAMEKLIWDCGFKARTLTWKSLLHAARIEKTCSTRTIQRAMETLDYRKCIACPKSWVSQANAQKRVQYAQIMLEKYPQPENWHHIRFSDEIHFGFGPQGRIRVIRRPGERYCPDCLQERRPPAEKDLKRLHAWAAIGYNFKSELVFYEVPGNSNGKMSLQIYRDKILEPVVKTWLENEGTEAFVLEEDNDSGHGTGKKNIVRDWKIAHGLKSYFNCSQSPDFVPIENAWSAPKEWIAQFESWDHETLKELAIEGWNRLPQSTINSWVDSIPQRFEDCINGGGKITGA